MVIVKTVVQNILLAVVLISMSIALSQCSEDAAEPVVAGRIVIDGGDAQVSLRGTELLEPISVRVWAVGGTQVLEGAQIVFNIIEGNGSVSTQFVTTNSSGVASTRWTLGATADLNRATATVVDAADLQVEFTATGADFYCPEADDAPSISYGTKGHLFLATRQSSWFPGSKSGIVRINPFFGQDTTTAFTEIPNLFNGTVIVTLKDAAFSPRGDFYVVRKGFTVDIVKVSSGGSVSLWVTTGQFDAEITMNPYGLLVGCDQTGPFVVGCRDTLQRFTEASYFSGINDDAVAVDPRRQSANALGEDIYFIDKDKKTLERLPLNNLQVEAGGLVTVTALTTAEANRASGMVCDNNGTVFILVDADTAETDPMKALVQVLPNGTKSIAYDFYDRVGGGEPLLKAGKQRDLAINTDTQRIWTLDTLNDLIVLYQIPTGTVSFVYEDADSLEKSTLSLPGLVTGERVGLAVLPN